VEAVGHLPAEVAEVGPLVGGVEERDPAPVERHDALHEADREAQVGDPLRGPAGRLLLELLRRDDLEGGLLVSRVFGGVKLGVGGVSRAFREAAEGALEALETP
jgi:hypothetical protein